MNRVTIRAIAAGGDGVATMEDGKTVFVPRGAPGDVATIEVTDDRTRWAKARLVAIETPSADRVEPPCPHYERDGCGGCQLQHLSLAGQLEAKRRIVGDALRRIGGFDDWEDPPIVGSPEPWRYRNRITLAGQGGHLGYHRQDAPAEVFDLVDCRLASAALMDLWAAIAPRRDLLPATVSSLVLREDPHGRRHVVAGGADPGVWDASALATAVDAPDVTYWWKPARGAARMVGGVGSDFPVTAFEQIQPRFGEAIRRSAVELLGDVSGRVVWDLYAGLGDAAARMAQAGGVVHAVESDGAAVSVGRERTAAVGPGAVKWHRGLVEDRVARLPEPHAVLVNPPRVGMAAPVADRLARWAEVTPGGRLAYVSCDPATLARDLKRMRRLAPVSVTAYDLFPQTAHVETVVVLEAA